MTDAPGANAKADYSFGQIAIKEGICSFDQVKECLDIQNKLRAIGIEPKKLGEILVEKGYLKPEQAVQIARIQAQGASTQRVSIPGYEIISRIGQGAIGSVYKARQISMDRIVAIKVLSAKYSKDKSFVDRFLREARAVAKLSHENIISGYDVGESGGVHYFVMEYVEGTPVSTILRREGRLDERRCLEIGIQIARALSHAYRNGIVHRDVKPENIMITANNVAKLCDLGLAKQAKDEAGATMDGMSVGTPNYISPEQARGEEKIDIRSDIYSLGASLYHMATGTTPFTGANTMVVMTKHVTEFPENPRKRNPAISEAFSNLILRMMEKRREDRPQDPDAVVAEMERILRGVRAEAVMPAVQAVAPGPAAVRPRTEIPARPVTRVVRPSSLRPASSSMPIFIVVGSLAAVAAIFFVAGGLSSSGGGGHPPGGAKKPEPKPQPEPEPGGLEDVQREIAAFRDYVGSRMANPTIADRFMTPYSQILERIEHYKKLSKFAGQKAWEMELESYTEEVNNLINTRIWSDIEKKVRQHYEAGRSGKALEELGRLEDVYKWFRRGASPVMTEAGKAHARWLERINRDARDTYVEQKKLAAQAFQEGRRDEAYRLLDGLAASATAEQRLEIDNARRGYLEREVAELRSGLAAKDGFRKALERIRQLKALHPSDAAVNQFLDDVAREITEREQKIAASAASHAAAAYVGFQPKYAEAMRTRDLPAVRRASFALLFGPDSAAYRLAFVAEGADAAVLRAWLDPARAEAFPQIRQVIALSESAARRPGGEAVKDFFLDLRDAALLEELVEQALQGAKAAAREAGKFKRFSQALRGAVSVEPAPRRPDQTSLNLTIRQGGGTAVQSASLAPTSPLITEDDIAALAREAAPSDALMPLKLFLLYYHANKMAAAKSWWDKLSTPELRFGTERYAERLRGIASEADEEAARKLYEQAVEAYVRKKDPRMLRECLEKYSHTEYMKARTSVGKTRIELIIERIGGATPKPQGAAGRMRDLFGAADVRELGRNRYDVVYEFKDDRELNLFASHGALGAALAAGGVRLSGNGTWYWRVPLRGNVAMEVSFRMETESPLGLVVHGDGDRAGYVFVVDLDLPGLGPVDGILKMPIRGLDSILAHGGRGLEVTRGSSYTARVIREGPGLRLALDGGSIEGKSAQYDRGNVGLMMAHGSILVQRLRVQGEVDPEWLDAELRRIGAAAER